MKSLTRAVWAESIKIKRTLALWLALIGPLAMAVLQFGIFYSQREMVAMKEDPWLWIFYQNLQFWCLLMLPLFIVLETALLAGLEHGNRGWKALYASPVPRWAIQAAKQWWALVLIGISMLALWLFTLIEGNLLHLLHPTMGLDAPSHWLLMLRETALAYLAGWLIIAINGWVSVRWSNFVVAIAFGILATVSGMFIINTSWGQYWPWALPGMVINDLWDGLSPWYRVAWGSLGGLAGFVLANWDLSRREVHS